MALLGAFRRGQGWICGPLCSSWAHSEARGLGSAGFDRCLEYLYSQFETPTLLGILVHTIASTHMPPELLKLTRRRVLYVVVALLAVALAIAIEQRRNIFRCLNVAAILSCDLDGRLIPHRVNRLATLDAVLDRGIRSMEIDLLLRQEDGGAFFEVGHDEGDVRGVRLDAFLERMKPFEMKKLWLDIKNLDATSVDVALTVLQDLDEEFGLREIALVESYTSAHELAAIGDAGFHSSNYLRLSQIGADRCRRPAGATAARELAGQADASTKSARGLVPAHAVSVRQGVSGAAVAGACEVSRMGLRGSSRLGGRRWAPVQ